MKHQHSVYDTDPHFIIDPVTREIVNQSGKTTIIQGDHNSERFTFELERMVDGHDMSLCNAVEVHYLNIDSATKDRVAGVYNVDDFDLDTNDKDVVILSWLISEKATTYVGFLNFLIRFCCIAENGEVEYAWNTAISTETFVSSGINNGSVVVDGYSDILEQWRADVEAAIGRADAKAVELQERFDNGEMRGEQGEQGVSGVYVGSGDMPAGYNVQIDPNGEADEGIPQWYLDQAKSYTDTAVSEAVKAAIDEAFDIGTVITKFDDKDYSDYLGFTWERFAQGKTLVGVSETDADFTKAGNSGGDKTHRLTVEEMPSHNHQQRAPVTGGSVYAYVNYEEKASSADNYKKAGLYTEYAGGGQAHNNMPPYITVYMWIRTA